jgi:hypothetical protein
MLEISWLAENLSALQEELCSKKLVIFPEEMLALLKDAIKINMAYNVTML